MRSHRVEARRADVLALWEANRSISLEELCVLLTLGGLTLSIAGLYRFFKRHGIAQKGGWARHRIEPPGHPEADALRREDQGHRRLRHLYVHHQRLPRRGPRSRLQVDRS